MILRLTTANKITHSKVTNYVKTFRARISVILSAHSNLTDTMPRRRHNEVDTR
jgi:hypothetical protein